MFFDLHPTESSKKYIYLLKAFLFIIWETTLKIINIYLLTKSQRSLRSPVSWQQSFNKLSPVQSHIQVCKVSWQQSYYKWSSVQSHIQVCKVSWQQSFHKLSPVLSHIQVCKVSWQQSFHKLSPILSHIQARLAGSRMV